MNRKCYKSALKRMCICIVLKQGDEESWDVKDSLSITAEESSKVVESRGQKVYIQTAPTSPHVVWEGFNERKRKRKMTSWKYQQIKNQNLTAP